MKILVTGHLGFLGSHLVDALVGKHEVVGIDDCSGGYTYNKNEGCKDYLFDLKLQRVTRETMERERPEAIFHLAANAAEGKSHFSPIDICTRNFNTFLNVITPAINSGLERFVYVSSMAVYGKGQVPFKENDTPLPEDPYGASKYACEMVLKSLAEVHGFEYVIIRPHNVYGPRQDMADPYRNVITIFMNSILAKKPWYIYGDGEQRRCFSYIDGITDALVKCVDASISGMTFNVGSDKDYSINDLAEAVIGVTKTKIKPIHLPDRANEVKIAIPNHDLAKEHLDLRDICTFEEGLKETWEYAKKLGYQKPRYTGFEIESNKIPKNWKKI